MNKNKKFILAAFMIGVAPFLFNGFYNPILARNPFLYWSADIMAWIIVPTLLLFVGIRNQYINFKSLGLHLTVQRLPILMISSILACPVLYYTYMESFAFAVSSYPVNHLKVSFSYHDLIPTAPPLSYLTTAYFSLTAGFVEEVLYRSLFFNLFQNTLLQKILFFMSSSLIFSLVHWEGGIHNLHASFMVGAVACLIFLITRNIWPCIIGHCFVDLVIYS